MKYEVRYTKEAFKQLKKPDTYTRTLILAWIEKNLVGSEDPCRHGKELTANRSGQWRYRVGDCRILADIRDGEILILILEIGHRRDIYEGS